MLRKTTDFKKTPVSSTTNRSRDSTINSYSIQSLRTEETKISDGPNKPSNEISNELKNFENLRSLLLEWITINAFIKNVTQNCGQRIEVEFFDRILQIIDSQDKITDLKLSFMREEAIKELEEILNIEGKVMLDIGKVLEDLQETLNVIEDFLENTLKKVYVGENIVINVDDFNNYLEISTQLIDKITNSYGDTLAENQESEQKLRELNSVILEEIEELKSILTLLDKKSSQKMDENLEKYSAIQNERLDSLKRQITEDL